MINPISAIMAVVTLVTVIVKHRLDSRSAPKKLEKPKQISYAKSYINPKFGSNAKSLPSLSTIVEETYASDEEKEAKVSAKPPASSLSQVPIIYHRGIKPGFKPFAPPKKPLQLKEVGIQSNLEPPMKLFESVGSSYLPGAFHPPNTLCCASILSKLIARPSKKNFRKITLPPEPKYRRNSLYEMTDEDRNDLIAQKRLLSNHCLTSAFSLKPQRALRLYETSFSGEKSHEGRKSLTSGPTEDAKNDRNASKETHKTSSSSTNASLFAKKNSENSLFLAPEPLKELKPPAEVPKVIEVKANDEVEKKETGDSKEKEPQTTLKLSSSSQIQPEKTKSSCQEKTKSPEKSHDSGKRQNEPNVEEPRPQKEPPNSEFSKTETSKPESLKPEPLNFSFQTPSFSQAMKSPEKERPCSESAPQVPKIVSEEPPRFFQNPSPCLSFFPPKEAPVSFFTKEAAPFGNSNPAETNKQSFFPSKSQSFFNSLGSNQESKRLFFSKEVEIQVPKPDPSSSFFRAQQNFQIESPSSANFASSSEPHHFFPASSKPDQTIPFRSADPLVQNTASQVQIPQVQKSGSEASPFFSGGGESSNPFIKSAMYANKETMSLARLASASNSLFSSR